MANYSKWDNIEDSDDDADDAMERAQALNERGTKLLMGQGKKPQPEAALEVFEQARKQLLQNGKPVSSDARDLAGGVLLNMAVAAHDLKRHEKVVEHATAVLDLEPANPYDRGQAYMWRAAGREQLGELREAIDDLKVALKLDPSNAEAGQRLANAERLCAAADYEAREERAKRANALLERAEAALVAKQWAEAKVACSAALPLLGTGQDFYRKRASVLHWLGVATASLGDVAAGRQHLVEAKGLLDEHDERQGEFEKKKNSGQEDTLRKNLDEWLESTARAVAS